MDFDFGSFFVGLIAGLAIAYFIIHQIGKMIFRKLEAAVAAESEQREQSRINMKVERHGDVLYAYNADNDDFICQGANLAELKQNFVARFPDRTGSVEGVNTELHAELLKQKQELAKTTWPNMTFVL